VTLSTSADVGRAVDTSRCGKIRPTRSTTTAIAATPATVRATLGDRHPVSGGDPAQPVDLDLTAYRGRAVEITVRAGSSVRVDLGSPCRVQAKGRSASLASQIDVTGCELQLGQGNRWATRRVRGIDGQPPIMLKAQVADSAELIVEGRP
jgi:hypothetical protein